MLGKGASWLVDGASRLALRLGVSAFVVGLTVVGFGTSMPELAVSVIAAMRGSGGLSIGNAVGSNIMNLLLVLGISAVVAPIVVVGGRRVLLRDLTFGLVPAAVLLMAAWDGLIERWVAALLLFVFTVFIATCLIQARQDSTTPTIVKGHPLRHLAFAALGIVVLVTGSELMVHGGIELARKFGVSEAVIGLTLVAFGTSLPELATSVAAAVKKQTEISVGNVLGSNVFNLGLIVGTAFMIRPNKVPTFIIHMDLPFLMVTTILVGLVVLRRGRIGKRAGIGMLVTFAGYIVFLAIRGN
jgi:cation:H+ antiporter